LLSGSTTTAWTALAITLPIITDAIYTLSRRLLNHENIFQAHRKHLYQRLQQTHPHHNWIRGFRRTISLSSKSIDRREIIKFCEKAG
jgi:Fuc2NAc and GlcNAc transferase